MARTQVLIMAPHKKIRHFFRELPIFGIISRIKCLVFTKFQVIFALKIFLSSSAPK